jgi:hypothetical protein
VCPVMSWSGRLSGVTGRPHQGGGLDTSRAEPLLKDEKVIRVA